MRCIQFLRPFFFGILNLEWKFQFLNFSTENSSKKFRPEPSESNTESEFRFQWGSQKSEPKIRIPNQGCLCQGKVRVRVRVTAGQGGCILIVWLPRSMLQLINNYCCHCCLCVVVEIVVVVPIPLITQSKWVG
jgi:hypothetical protein